MILLLLLVVDVETVAAGYWGGGQSCIYSNYDCWPFRRVNIQYRLGPV